MGRRWPSPKSRRVRRATIPTTSTGRPRRSPRRPRPRSRLSPASRRALHSSALCPIVTLVVCRRAPIAYGYLRFVMTGARMKKRRNEDDYAKTQVLERGHGQRSGAKDEADALYQEYVETTEPDAGDQTITHKWRGSSKG